MTIEKLTAENVKLAAPLAAAFRVKLSSFKGLETEANIEDAEEELSGYIESGYPVFAAFDGEMPIGYIVCRVDEPCVWAESLYVLPEYRRRGVGSALFEKAEQLAASFGENTVYNYIHPNNEAVIAFLRSRGYTVLNLIEIRKPYEGEKLSQKIDVNGHEFDY